MITFSEHTFSSPSELHQICISIAEVVDEDHGLHVWPCSVALAEYVWQQKHRFAGAQVVELGAGTALPGILAAKIGAHVILTDVHDKPEVFENMQRNCEHNAVDCKTQSLTWANWDVETFDMSPDIIIGADVLYDPEDFDDLFATVAFMLCNKPEAVFITSYEARSQHRSIELLMVKWKLKCTKLLDVHDILPDSKASLISNSIEIIEITLAENA